VDPRKSVAAFGVDFLIRVDPRKSAAKPLIFAGTTQPTRAPFLARSLREKWDTTLPAPSGLPENRN